MGSVDGPMLMTGRNNRVVYQSGESERPPAFEIPAVLQGPVLLAQSALAALSFLSAYMYSSGVLLCLEAHIVDNLSAGTDTIDAFTAFAKKPWAESGGLRCVVRHCPPGRYQDAKVNDGRIPRRLVSSTTQPVLDVVTLRSVHSGWRADLWISNLLQKLDLLIETEWPKMSVPATHIAITSTRISDSASGIRKLR